MPANNRRKNPFLLAPALTFVVLAFLAVLQSIRIDATGGAAYVTAAVLILILYGVPSAAYFLLREKGARSIGPVRSLSRRQVWISVVAAMLMSLQTCLLKYGLFHMKYDSSLYEVYGFSFSREGASFADICFMLMIPILLCAACEEWFFRGIVAHEYRVGGAFIASLATATLYAMTSLQFSQFPILLFNGLLLSLAVMLTGNLLSSFFANAFYKFFSLFCERYVFQISEEPESRFLFFVLAVSLCLFFWAVLSALAEKELLARARSQQTTLVSRELRKEMVFCVVAAPPMWLNAVLFFVISLAMLFL